MFNTMNRREVLIRSIPALAAAGTLAGSASLLAQNARPQARFRGNGAGNGSPVAEAIAQGYQEDEYTLPPLAYEYDALEPHIDQETMMLHHSRHHQAYVDGLNRAVRAAREMGADDIDGQKLAGLQRDITFNGGGHVLHTVFWATMAPEDNGGGGEPQGEIAEAIERQFGDFESFTRYYSAVAGGVKGSGWAILAYEPMADGLAVYQFSDQDAFYIPGSVPLLPLDVWEHAYYISYRNERTRYVETWWNVVNWPAVNEAYTAVRELYGKA